MRIEATGADIPPGPFAGVVATSARALATSGLKPLPGDLLTLPFFAVGDRTAAAAAAAGFRCIEPAAPTAADLVMLILFVVRRGSRLLYLAGRDRKPGLESDLARLGVQVETVEVYEARAVDLLPDVAHGALWDGRVDAVLHFSRRSAELFVELARKAGLGAAAARARHVAISADAAGPLRDFAPRIVVARQPTARSLYDSL